MQPLPDLSVSDRLVVNQTGFALWVASFRQTLHTTPAGWFVAAWMAWGRVPDQNLLLWLVLFFVVWMMGLLSIDRALKDGCDQQTHGPRLRVMAALDGIAWGLLGWLLAGHDVLLDAIMVALLCGVSAVNAQVYVSYIRGYYLQSGLMWSISVLGLARYANQQYTVDLTARAKAGEVVTTANGVQIVGHTNLPGRIASDASSLYAKNLVAFVGLMIKDGALALDMEDEILKASAVTHGGAVVHEGVRG